MATVNIGNLTFTHKGDYASGTAYVKNDVVYYATNGNAYIAKQATQGNAPTNATYWSQFAQGSGGIWNAGLSLGSASQKLRVNSGGNALEFFTEPTVTSDFVNLASHRSTNTTSQVSLDGYFTSDYEHYLIRAYLLDDKWLKFRFNVGGSTHTGSNWNWVNDKVYRTSSSQSSSIAGAFNSDYCPVIWHSQISNVQSNVQILISNPLGTSRYKTIEFTTSGYNNSNEVQNEHGAGYFHGTQGALSGFTFVQSSGTNFDDIGIDLYGLK